MTTDDENTGYDKVLFNRSTDIEDEDENERAQVCLLTTTSREHLCALVDTYTNKHNALNEVTLALTAALQCTCRRCRRHSSRRYSTTEGLQQALDDARAWGAAREDLARLSMGVHLHGLSALGEERRPKTPAATGDRRSIGVHLTGRTIFIRMPETEEENRLIARLTGLSSEIKKVRNQLEAFNPRRFGKPRFGQDMATGKDATAIDDIEYFRSKMFSALKIPKAYLNQDENTATVTSAVAKSVVDPVAAGTTPEASAYVRGRETTCDVVYTHLPLTGFTLLLDEARRDPVTPQEVTASAWSTDFERRLKAVRDSTPLTPEGRVDYRKKDALLLELLAEAQARTPTSTESNPVDLSRFPHTCLRCGKPSYDGAFLSECSDSACGRG